MDAPTRESDVELEEALTNFARLVEAYFGSSSPSSSSSVSPSATAGSYEVLQLVLDSYERCKATQDGVVAVTHASATTLSEARERLCSIGFVEANASIESCPPDASTTVIMMRMTHFARLDAYEKVKNKARSAYHAARAQELESEFVRQLAAIFELRSMLHNEDDPGEIIFQCPIDDEEDDETFHLTQAKTVLTTFVQKYRMVRQHLDI